VGAGPDRRRRTTTYLSEGDGWSPRDGRRRCGCSAKRGSLQGTPRVLCGTPLISDANAGRVLQHAAKAGLQTPAWRHPSASLRHRSRGDPRRPNGHCGWADVVLGAAAVVAVFVRPSIAPAEARNARLMKERTRKQTAHAPAQRASAFSWTPLSAGVRLIPDRGDYRALGDALLVRAPRIASTASTALGGAGRAREPGGPHRVRASRFMPPPRFEPVAPPLEVSRNPPRQPLA
jgi:hypothetical protein